MTCYCQGQEEEECKEEEEDKEEQEEKVDKEEEKGLISMATRCVLSGCWD